MPKPSDFFIGIVDFFAILLPGAIATAILAPKFGKLVLGPLITVPGTAAGNWVAFLICAYFLGHIIFLLGSYIDRFYNSVRTRLNPYGNESAYQCATTIRDSFVRESQRNALNTFQWTRSVLISTCPAAAEDVHRLEADSKFFRSLLIVCALGAIVFFADGRRIEGTVALTFGIPCFARYYERRLKSTTQAYIHVVTLQGLGRLRSDPNSDSAIVRQGATATESGRVSSSPQD